MGKETAEHGVSQLTLTFPNFTGKDGTPAADRTGDLPGENVPSSSTAPSTDRKRPWRKQKWHSLIDKVYSLQNLQSAWSHVAENDGACGVDGITVTQYEANVVEWLQELSTDLREKTYRPKPVRRVYIPKGSGGRRPLGIPTVRDRIVQQAVLQVLEPVFEGKFSRYSHGFRKGRGCATALSVVDQAVRHGYQWVVDADIEAFFDTVDHELMLSALNEEVADGSLLRLIRRMLASGVLEPSVSEVEATERGTPQGGPLSPLLANIYLHVLDVQMEAAGYGLVRYADDFVIFARSKDEAAKALQLARDILEGQCGLTLHKEKTRVVSVDEGFAFLGFHYFRDPKTGQLQKEVRAKSARTFREAVRQRTPRLRTQRRFKRKHCTVTRLEKNRRVQAMLLELNRYLTGWHWYFKTVWSRYPATPFRNFDGFVRRRVRTAITGRTGSQWNNSHLPNALLQSLGLKALDDLQRAYQNGSTVLPARKG